MAEIRVLHVDDEPDVRLLVEASLGLDPGLVTQSCASGVEALAIAAHWRPDVILLDATMPDMDGPATLAQLKHDPQTAGIPVLFLTASCRASDVNAFKALGSVGVIAKPFDPRALAPSVRSHAQPLAPEPAVIEATASPLASPHGAGVPDSGPLNHTAGPGTSMASDLGATTSSAADASAIALVDRSGRSSMLPLGRDINDGGHDWTWQPNVSSGVTWSLDPTFDGHVTLLDFDPRELGSAGLGSADPMSAELGPANSLFSGSRASGYDASSDLVHAHAWQGGDPLATGPGHDVWAVGSSLPTLHEHKPFG